jgi:hypothetical protein
MIEAPSTDHGLAETLEDALRDVRGSLMRTALLFAAPALTGGDQPHHLIRTHATHGSRGISIDPRTTAPRPSRNSAG